MVDNQNELSNKNLIDERKCIKQAMRDDVRMLTLLAIEHICASGFNDERKMRNINSAVEVSNDILKGVETL